MSQLSSLKMFTAEHLRAITHIHRKDQQDLAEIKKICEMVNQKVLAAAESGKDFCEIHFTEISETVFEDVFTYVSTLYPGVKVIRIRYQSDKTKCCLTLDWHEPIFSSTDEGEAWFRDEYARE